MTTQSMRAVSSARPSLGWRVGRQIARLAIILIVSALVVWGTIALASSALGPIITNAMAPTAARPGAAPKPSVSAPAGQPARSAQEPTTPGAQTRPAGGGGRNVPSIERGMPDLIKYGGVVAGATLAVVLLLRVRRPRPRLNPVPRKTVD